MCTWRKLVIPFPIIPSPHAPIFFFFNWMLINLYNKIFLKLSFLFFTGNSSIVIVLPVYAFPSHNVFECRLCLGEFILKEKIIWFHFFKWKIFKCLLSRLRLMNDLNWVITCHIIYNGLTLYYLIFRF